MLIPELGDAIVQLPELLGEDSVSPLGEAMSEVGAVLARALDLVTDFSQLSHIWENDGSDRLIPSAVTQLLDPFLVQPEEVSDLVEDGDPDLAAELLRVGKRVHERQAVDHDSIR